MVPQHSRYEVNKPEVVDESVDGEALIVHLGTGAYYSSRGNGDATWQLLASGSTPAEVAGLLAVSIAEVAEFAAQLVEEQLLRPRESAAAVPPQVSAPGGPLVLEKYVDMQELLLLDPIHDVEEAGWPRAKQGAAGA